MSNCQVNIENKNKSELLNRAVLLLTVSTDGIGCFRILWVMIPSIIRKEQLNLLIIYVIFRVCKSVWFFCFWNQLILVLFLKYLKSLDPY